MLALISEFCQKQKLTLRHYPDVETKQEKEEIDLPSMLSLNQPTLHHANTSSKTKSKSQPTNPIFLVRELCQHQKWSQREQSILEEMGLLHNTLESFLVPGKRILSQILKEAGLSQSRIDAFLSQAVEQVNINKTLSAQANDGAMQHQNYSYDPKPPPTATATSTTI